MAVLRVISDIGEVGSTVLRATGGSSRGRTSVLLAALLVVSLVAPYPLATVESASAYDCRGTNGYKFCIDSVSLSSYEVEQGETIAIEVTIENRGDRLGSVNAYRGVEWPNGDRDYELHKYYDIPVGGSKTKTFYYTVPEYAPTGEYSVTIDVYTPPEGHMFDTTGFVYDFRVADQSTPTPTSTPAGPPDLEVTDVDWRPSDPNAGDDIEFQLTLKNTGGQEARTVESEVRVDGRLVAVPPTTTLSPGETYTTPWTASDDIEGGIHTVSAWIDPDDHKYESDESNNEHTESMTVGTSAGGIEGYVTDGYGSPLSGARVYLDDTTDTRTNSDGYYSFEGIAPGEHDLYVNAGACYDTGSRSVRVQESDTAYRAFELDRRTFSLNLASEPIWVNTDGEGSYGCGEEVTVSAPGEKDGYEFQAWETRDGEFVTDRARFTIDHLTQDYNIVAQYARPGKPDLVVEDIYWEPTRPEQGHSVTLFVEVANTGQARESSTAVETSIDGQIYHTKNVDLDPGESRTIRIADAWTSAGDRATVSAEIDYADEVDEESEWNNDHEETISVAVSESDLRVVDIDLRPSDPRVDEDVQFRLTIENVGDARAETVESEVRINGGVVAVLTTHTFSAGETYTTPWAGHFKFEAGSYTVVGEVDPDDHIAEADEGNNVDSADVSLDRSTGTVTGRVLDASGDPIEGSVVYLDGEWAAQTDSHGRYEITDVPAGRHTVEIAPWGYESDSESVQVDVGERVKEDFQLTSTTQTTALTSTGTPTLTASPTPAPTGTVSVQVRQDGGGVFDAVVWFPRLDRPRQSVSERSPVATFKDVPEGRHIVKVERKGAIGSTARLVVEVERDRPTSDTIHIQAVSTLSGSVTQASGKVLTDGAVIAGGRPTEIRSDGTYEFKRPFAPGTYEFVVEADGSVLRRETVEIDPGSTTYDVVVGSIGSGEGAAKAADYASTGAVWGKLGVMLDKEGHDTVPYLLGWIGLSVTPIADAPADVRDCLTPYGSLGGALLDCGGAVVSLVGSAGTIAGAATSWSGVGAGVMVVSGGVDTIEDVSDLTRIFTVWMKALPEGRLDELGRKAGTELYGVIGGKVRKVADRVKNPQWARALRKGADRGEVLKPLSPYSKSRLKATGKLDEVETVADARAVDALIEYRRLTGNADYVPKSTGTYAEVLRVTDIVNGKTVGYATRSSRVTRFWDDGARLVTSGDEIAKAEEGETLLIRGLEVVDDGGRTVDELDIVVMKIVDGNPQVKYVEEVKTETNVKRGHDELVTRKREAIDMIRTGDARVRGGHLSEEAFATTRNSDTASESIAVGVTGLKETEDLGLKYDTVFTYSQSELEEMYDIARKLAANTSGG